MKTLDDKEVFFKVRLRIALFTGLLVGACSCTHSISCFQDDFSVLKAFRLKVFKCPNKESNFLSDKNVC